MELEQFFNQVLNLLRQADHPLAKVKTRKSTAKDGQWEFLQFAMEPDREVETLGLHYEIFWDKAAGDKIYFELHHETVHKKDEFDDFIFTYSDRLEKNFKLVEWFDFPKENQGGFKLRYKKGIKANSGNAAQKMFEIIQQAYQLLKDPVQKYYENYITEQKIVENLIKKTKFFQNLKDDENFLFEQLNNLAENKQLLKELQQYWTKNFGVVNTLRLLIVEDLLNGRTVDNQKIEFYKTIIQNKDINQLKKLNLHESIINQLLQQEYKNYFQSWKNFSILFRFFYDKSVRDDLQKLSDHFADEFGLENYGVHIHDFSGNQQFGDTELYVNFYDAEIGNFRNSYNLYFKINTKGLEGGLNKGDNIIAHEPLKNKIFSYWYEFENFIVEEELDIKWINLNQILKIENSLIEFLQILGEEASKQFYEVIDLIIEKLQIKSTDERIVFWIRNDRRSINFKISNRYIFAYDLDFKKKYNKPFAFILPSSVNCINENTQEVSFTSNKDLKLCLTDDIQVIFNFQNQFLSTIEQILQKAGSQKREGNNLALHYSIFNKSYRQKLFAMAFGTSKSQREIQPSSHPLNLILYGPPGTGKTYKTIELAVKIADPEFYQQNQNNRKALRQRFNELKQQSQIAFVTFHQSMTYEDFIEGIKPNFDTKELTYTIEDGIFKRICNLASSNPDKNYVLIIDEINRGNIASIFGELITLIEEDKRKGADEELSVTLPYSKEKFSVPKNLYIIGTMNTADRSVEALDTALRRRFTFEKMPPKVNLIEPKEINGINLRDLLKAINDRIELLLDKDHQIGHSYFIGIETFDELKEVFENKIIPLLQEYFYNDLGKIGLILGKDFVQKAPSQVEFADFQDYDELELQELKEKPVYKITSSQEWTPESFKNIYSK